MQYFRSKLKVSESKGRGVKQELEVSGKGRKQF